MGPPSAKAWVLGTLLAFSPPPKGGQLGVGPQPVQTLPFAWGPKEHRGGGSSGPHLCGKQAGTHPSQGLSLLQLVTMQIKCL